jgi:exodeoxyribonuclease-3
MTWKLATFNVNGIRARLATVVEWISVHQPDVLCCQEIKCQEKDFPARPFEEAGYHVSLRGQKSFNGVALITRNPPEALVREFSDGQPDDEARFIAARIDGVWVVNTYVPQGRDPDNPAFQSKLQFFRRLNHWFEKQFNPDQPLIWTGDLNVAPTAMDVFDPKRLEGSVGFHPLEREAFSEVCAWGFTDCYRRHHPEKRQFTFWDYRLPKSFERNLGWRLDHLLATSPLAEVCLDCQVDSELRGRQNPSDHTPVWANFDLDKLRAFERS